MAALVSEVARSAENFSATLYVTEYIINGLKLASM